MSIAWENTTAVEILEFSSNHTIDQKIKSAASGLQKNVQRLFLEFAKDHDKEQVADFILVSVKQENIGMTQRGFAL